MTAKSLKYKCMDGWSLPAIADLWGRVSGVVWGFRSSVWRARAAATMSVMQSIRLIGCQRMDIWNVWTNKSHGWNKTLTSLVCFRWIQPLPSLSPSLSEALAEGMLSSRSGMFSRVALSSLWTTIFSLPFDLSISFLASIKERFSVTVPLIWDNQKKKLLAMTRQINRKTNQTSIPLK